MGELRFRTKWVSGQAGGDKVASEEAAAGPGQGGGRGQGAGWLQPGDQEGLAGPAAQVKGWKPRPGLLLPCQPAMGPRVSRKCQPWGGGGSEPEAAEGALAARCHCTSAIKILQRKSKAPTGEMKCELSLSLSNTQTSASKMGQVKAVGVGCGGRVEGEEAQGWEQPGCCAHSPFWHRGW